MSCYPSSHWLFTPLSVAFSNVAPLTSPNRIFRITRVSDTPSVTVTPCLFLLIATYLLHSSVKFCHHYCAFYVLLCPPLRILRPTYHPLMNCVTTPTTSCSTRLFACLITCCIPFFRRHLTHHKDTICENERIYCNYLIPHTSQTKISSHTCCVKTHTRGGLQERSVNCAVS